MRLLWGDAMPILFKIDSTDLTEWEDKEQHSVNQEEVYASWTDGNYIEHREVVRTRISGSVVLTVVSGMGVGSVVAC